MKWILRVIPLLIALRCRIGKGTDVRRRPRERLARERLEVVVVTPIPASVLTDWAAFDEGAGYERGCAARENGKSPRSNCDRRRVRFEAVVVGNRPIRLCLRPDDSGAAK